MSSHEVPDAPQAHQLDTTPDETAALRLWVIMSRAHAAIAEHAAADVSRHGLTLTEFAIVEALYHRGPLLLGEVQKRILVSSGGITFLVDRLDRTWYLTIGPCLLGMRRFGSRMESLYSPTRAVPTALISTCDALWSSRRTSQFSFALVVQ